MNVILRKLYFIPIPLRVVPSESVALHLSVLNNESYRYIVYNDYKFAIYPHSISQDLAVENKVMVIICTEIL